MKKIFFVFLLAICVLAESCSDLKVTSDYDKSADFTSFSTFNLMTNDEGMTAPDGVSRLTVSFIEESIIDQLMKRNYTLSDNPDIGVYYYIKVAEKTKLTGGSSVGVYAGNPYYYGYYGGYGYYSTSIQEVNYAEGSLIIELVDMKENKAIWQGVATQSVTQSSVTDKQIQQIVNSIFFKYKWKAEVAEDPAPKTGSAPKSNVKNADK